MKHPMQPIVKAEDGSIHFQENSIIVWLFETGKLNVNEVFVKPFHADDMMQIAQLLGYSVSGFGDLSYADPAVVAEADAIAEELRKTPSNETS